MDALREQHERELRDAAEVRPACLPAWVPRHVEISWDRVTIRTG
eukprot:COSAG02_NODE_8853_length_2421_cov_2.423342_2_plen_44_part_00